MNIAVFDLVLGWAFWSFVVIGSLLLIAFVRAAIWELTDRIRFAVRRLSASHKKPRANR